MTGSESQSTRPSMPLWLILVTLLGGAFLVQRGNQPAEDKSGGAPPPSHAGIEATNSDANDRLLAPLREFLGVPLAESVGPPPTPDKDNLSKRIKSSVGLLEFLVVMVADPIETATNYRFDLQLDTLHKALGADGYVPDHYYLPWGYQEKANLHRAEPGVLLYRRNGPSASTCVNPQERNDLLLVYLVGETPTSGIHKDAFLTAVRQIKTLGEMAPCPEPSSRTTIRVAGPLFTGAADSLALAIRQARGDRITSAKFQVITGTAVSIDRARFETLAGKGNADLHATVLFGNILRQALISHVLERSWSNKVRIAWLTETGTGYGSSISINKRGRQEIEEDIEERKQQERNEWEEYEQLQPMWQQSVVPLNPSQIEAAESTKSTKTGPEASPSPASSRAEIIEFRFPVNISRVRSGYTESRRRERSGQASLGPESSRLPIPFEDTSTARDVPPMQTPKVTAPTVELILGQILTTIRSEGIKYVGISSSDPRDPIFLAELIKEQCPDVQIMLVTSDLLHLHSEYRSIMHGTLVSSTHPLHSEAQDWCFPFGEERDGNSRSNVLSSQSNYGLYNAVLFLRGLERGQYTPAEQPDRKGELTLSYTQQTDWPGGLPLGYGMPFDEEIAGGATLRPPVWISRISPTGICPITVRRTDKDYKSDYTINLKIATPPPVTDPRTLPALRIRSRIPASLYIASLLWLVSSAIYCAALLFPKPVGNWAKALTIVADDAAEFKSLIYVFRCYLTGSFLYVLFMFASLLFVYHRWVGVQVFGDYLTVIQCVLCYFVAFILTLCLLADWGRAFYGMAIDLFGAMQRLIAYVKNRPAAAPAGAPAGEPDLSWHLIAARGVGLTMILALAGIYVCAMVWQRRQWDWGPNGDWGPHKEDSFLWFKVTSDMWNGLSPAMTAQLLAVGLIILAYGMLLQMHLLSPEYTIIRPDPSTSTPPSDNERQKRLEEVRNSLLFPLLCRWRRNRPVVLDILCVAAAILWLGFLAWHLQSPDFFAMPVSFATTLLLFAGGYWCVRLFKLVQILKGFARQLEELTKTLRERWPDSWPTIFEQLPEKRAGLQEVIWANRPAVNDREWDKARKALQEIQAPEGHRLKAEQKLCAIEIDLYVRQFFHHIIRLGMGLVVSACLLFLSAQAFPFSQEPLLRLSASIMLAAIGGVMAWYYLKFDRNELLSRLVGTDPKRISVNWSLIQMVAPALLLTTVALLSQTFPEIWQWIRGVLEPMARSSI